MPKRFFIASDIHSCFTPFKKALWDAGFRKTNSNDYLIIAGDVFDRGNESAELFDFLMSIPKNRLIMIRGNHEDLMMDLLEKDTPDSYDYSNGTVKTICSFTGYDENDIRFNYLFSDDSNRINNVWKFAVEDFKNLKVYKWLSDKKNWNNYYELGDYIITHSFIPVDIKPEYEYFKNWPHYELNPAVFCEKKDWRANATDYDWSEARWGCPWQQFKLGLFNTELENGKTLVCGHWHSADFFTNLDGVETPITESRLYRGNGIIALDACTALNKYCNILKIEME